MPSRSSSRQVSGHRKLVGIIVLSSAALAPACEPLPPDDEPVAETENVEGTDQYLVVDTDGRVFNAPFETMAQEPLRRAAATPESWHYIMTATFGAGHDAGKAERLRKHIAKGFFSWTPRVHLVEKGALGEHTAAYAESIRTVFIDKSLPEGIFRARAFIEEIGHYLDTVLNDKDTPGDEGLLFTRYMLGDLISAEDLQSIKAHDDHGTFNWGGEQLEVEHLSWPGVAACVLLPATCPIVVVHEVIKWKYPDFPTVGEMLDWASHQAYRGASFLTSWIPDGARDIAGRVVNGLINRNFNPLTFVQDLNRLRTIIGAAWDGIKDGSDLLVRAAERISKGDFKAGVADLFVGLTYVGSLGVANPDFLLTLGHNELSKLQTQLGLEPTGRPVNATERQLLNTVFGSGLNTNPIIIKEGFAGLLSVNDRAVTLDNTIYLKNSYSHKLLIHEATHVWQFQTRGVKYKIEALKDQDEGYIWATGFHAGHTFDQLHPEAQAKLIDNGFNDVIGRGRHVAHWKYGAGVPEAAATRYFMQGLAVVSRGAWNGRYYRRFDAQAVYRTTADSVCHVTWNQFVRAGQPSPTIIAFPQGEDTANGGAGIASCPDLPLDLTGGSGAGGVPIKGRPPTMF